MESESIIRPRAIELVLPIFVAFFAPSQVHSSEYEDLRQQFSRCDPHGPGGIVDDSAVEIKFFFLSDKEACADGSQNNIVQVIKNLHPDRYLVFKWEKTLLSRNARYPLPPNKDVVDVRQTGVSDLDDMAPIQYTPSLTRNRATSAYIVGANNDSNVTADDGIFSSIISSFVNLLGEVVGINVSISSNLDNQTVSYNIQIDPPYLQVGLGSLPYVAPEAFASVHEKLTQDGASIKLVNLSDYIKDEDLNQLPLTFSKDPLWVVSKNNDSGSKAEIFMDLPADKAERGVIPLAIMDASGLPILTGGASIYLPSQRSP